MYLLYKIKRNYVFLRLWDLLYNVTLNYALFRRVHGC